MEKELKEAAKAEAVNNDLVHLQHCHVTQYSDSTGNSMWKVRKNVTSEDLFELPSELTEEEVFKILEFAREFELIAFNVGIKFGKKEMRRSYEETINTYERTLQLAREENERLSNKLIKLISKEM